MIELRWVRGGFKGEAFAENNHGESFRLQYRYQETEIDGYVRWSEWIDVPTVTEG